MPRDRDFGNHMRLRQVMQDLAGIVLEDILGEEKLVPALIKACSLDSKLIAEIIIRAILYDISFKGITLIPLQEKKTIVLEDCRARFDGNTLYLIVIFRNTRFNEKKTYCIKVGRYESLALCSYEETMRELERSSRRPTE